MNLTFVIHLSLTFVILSILIFVILWNTFRILSSVTFVLLSNLTFVILSHRMFLILSNLTLVILSDYTHISSSRRLFFPRLTFPILSKISLYSWKFDYAWSSEGHYVHIWAIAGRSQVLVPVIQFSCCSAVLVWANRETRIWRLSPISCSWPISIHGRAGRVDKCVA